MLIVGYRAVVAVIPLLDADDMPMAAGRAVSFVLVVILKVVDVYAESERLEKERSGCQLIEVGRRCLLEVGGC